MRTLLPLLLVLASSCGISEDKWPDKSAKAQCKFAERCSTAQFYYNYDDVGACVDDTLEFWEEYEDFYLTCDFDADKAKACLKALDTRCKKAGQTYDDLFETCFEVWDCGDDFSDTDMPL